MKTVELLPNGPTVHDLVDLARRESGVLLTKSGEPVATVIPVPEKPRQRVAPLHPGAWEMAPDFDAPLPDEFWLGKE